MASNPNNTSSEKEPLSSRYEILLFILILVIGFSLRMFFLHEPFERDEGVYAYIGQQILRGEIPYRDVIDIKPPGIYYLYAIGIYLFGDKTESIRLFTAFYSLFTIGAVYLTARCLRGVPTALSAALIYCTYSTLPHLHGGSSNTEVFLALPLVLSIYFLLGINNDRRTNLVLSGFFAGTAMVVKTVAITQVSVIIVFLALFQTAGRGYRRVLSDIFFFCLPILILATGVLAYFAAVGALEDFVYWNVTFPGKYVNSDLKGPNWFPVFVYLFTDIFPLAVLGVPAAIGMYVKNREKGYLLLLFSVIAACIAILLPGKLFPHYFLLVIPPLALCAGIGLGEVVEKRDRSSQGVTVLLVILLLFPVQKYYSYYLVDSPDEVSEKKYGPVFVRSREIAAYIKANSLSTDYIYQWGMAMELYFLSGRRSPNKFPCNYFLQWSPDSLQALREMLTSIDENRPKFIYVDRSWAQMFGYSELQSLLKKDYLFDRKNDFGTLFRRRELSAATSAL